MKTFLGNCAIYMGAMCLTYAIFLTLQRNAPQSEIASEIITAHYVSAEQTQAPVELRINDLGLELPIYPAQVIDDRWETNSNGVSFLTSTPKPGETGNSILYGHNWPRLLGRLTEVKPGQEITIIFADGSSKTFVIAFTTTVTPDQTHVLGQTDDTRITLYTCEGFLDSKRFVVTALLKTETI